MKLYVSLIIPAGIICMLLTTMTVWADQNRAAIKIFNAKDAPVELLRVLPQNNFNLLLTIANKTNKEVESIVIHGIAFSSSGNANGGFLVGLSVNLPAGQQTDVAIDLNKNLNMKVQTMIITPIKAYFRMFNNQGEAISEYDFWILEKKQIENMNPNNIDAFKEVHGELFSPNAGKPVPSATFCEWCRDQAAGDCGAPIIAGECRYYSVCASGFLCNQQQQTCIYSCKDPIQCC